MDRFCTNCGQKLPDNSDFCTNCGTRVSASQPQQQQFQQPQQQQFQQQPQFNQNFGGQPNQGFNGNNNVDPSLKSKNTIALALGIVGLCLGIIGSMLFGVFLSIPSLVCGIVGIVMAIDLKKKSNGTLGQGALVVGILAVIFSAIFTIGCATLNSGTAGYGCYGCVGAGCKASNDISNAYSDLYDLNW